MQRPRVLGYCAYCKDEIYITEEFTIEGSEVFHPECLEQKNTFYDPYDEGWQ